MLADVGVRAVVELAHGGQRVVREHQSELPPHLAVAGLARLPAGAADGTDDGVDLLDDVLDQRGCVLGCVLLEDLGERALVRVG